MAEQLLSSMQVWERSIGDVPTAEVEWYAGLAADAMTYLDDIEVARQQDKNDGITTSSDSSAVRQLEAEWRAANGVVYTNNLVQWFREPGAKGAYDAFANDARGDVSSQPGAEAIRALQSTEPEFYAACTEQVRRAHIASQERVDGLGLLARGDIAKDDFRSYEVIATVEGLIAEMYLSSARSWLVQHLGTNLYDQQFANPTNE